MYYAAQQENVRKNSHLLVGLFILTLLVMTAAITITLIFCSWDPPDALLASIAFVAVIVGGASIYRFASLSGGGSVIPNQLGAVLVDPHTEDFQLKRLRNIVEEISIASGVQVPAIFVLNNESGINAFASGFSTSDAAITVTRGALIYLNRDELQAVIAHEYSHVLNGDMRLNLRMVALLFGLMVVGIIGKKIIYFTLRGRVRGKGVAYVLLIGFVLMAAGFLGWFCGRLIKASINRQREFLADASAVQFTRQASGITGALKKIGVLEGGSDLVNPNADEYGHMFFGEESKPFIHMLDTHPPLLDRIQVIEPKFTEQDLQSLKNQGPAYFLSAADYSSAPKTPQATAATAMLAAATAGALTTNAVNAHVTTPPQADHYQQASIMIHNLPDALQAAARNYYGVMPLICALLFSSDSEIAAQQETVVRMNHSDTMLASAKSFYAAIRELEPLQRLPLLSLCFPALRQHPKEDLKKFSDTIQALLQADKQISFHDYCLGTMLSKQIDEFLNPMQSAKIGNASLKSQKGAAVKLFTVLAAYGNKDEAEARAAFTDGMKVALPDVTPDFVPTPAFAGTLDQVWGPLDSLGPLEKLQLIRGLIVTISHDNQITLEEAELLRTVCTLIHCPLPPIFQMADAAGSGMTSNSANVTI